MEDPTPMEQTADRAQKLIAAITMLATASFMPEGEYLLLTTLCALIEPAEA